jgi:putative DNA primase/helicase
MFDTSAEAVRYIESKKGREADHSWTYHDADGEPVGIVLRWNLPGGKKDIRPVSRHADGWRIGGMPEPRPLYRLTELAHADRLCVCEGEKAVEAARLIGLTATTSAHGSKSAKQTDWGPLAGKFVIILPDNDAPGWQYAEDVTRILTQLDPPAVVKVVYLPDLPDKGDIVDWLAAHSNAVEPNTLRRDVRLALDDHLV